MKQPIKARESVVINKMGQGYSIRAPWHNDGQDVLISGKDRTLLQKVVDNLFLVRDGQRTAQDIYR